MPRCKMNIILRKYFIILLGLFVLFIWVNHYNKSDDNENDIGYEHFPVVSPETTSDWLPPDFQSREKHLREIIRKNKMFARVREMGNEREIQDDQSSIEIIDVFDTEATSEAAKPSRYFVNSTKCKIPFVDPFSGKAMKIYQPSKLKSCSLDPDLFQLSYDPSTKHYQLQVNQSNILKLNVNVKSLRCNYRGVTRGKGNTPDKHSVLHPPVYFMGKCTLPQNLSGIVVECRDRSDGSRIVQQDAFALVQVANRSRRIKSHPLDRQPSVLILGLESMSRMNFRRTMPKTAEFVRNQGWFELEGYSKVASDTLPNLLAVLSGNWMDQGNIPWIWMDYTKAGYAAVLAEDNDDTSFAQNLSRFDLRPLFLAINRTMSNYRRSGLNYCHGRRLSISYVLDFCSQFTSRYVEELDQPAFGLFWSSSFPFAASSLDQKFVDFLHLLEKKKLFENSVVILMSDQGTRSKELLKLSDGFLEERLPMLHIHLPPWFRETYPKFAEALFLNRNRLCSNFDLHNTLKHLLQLNASTAAELPPLKSCPNSQSLLHPLPEERSCKDACIGEHFCACDEFVSQTIDGDIYLLGKQVIYHINLWMLRLGYNELCQRILLQDMEYAAKKTLPEENGTEAIYGSIVTYRLRLRSYPYGAIYQATINYNPELRTIDNLYVPDISRLNSFGNHSNCVENKVAKKFCVCYPQGKLSPFMNNWKKLTLTTQEG